MRISLLAAALACAVLCTDAFAAINLQRSTNLNDSLGGTLSVATTGSIELPGADTSSTLTLTNFHPHDNADLVANGSLTRTHTRANETVTNTYNGSASLVGTDKDGKAVNDTLALDNVEVVRHGDGPAFSGSIVFNGKTYDAAHLDEQGKHALRRVLRLFDFD